MLYKQTIAQSILEHWNFEDCFLAVRKWYMDSLKVWPEKGQEKTLQLFDAIRVNARPNGPDWISIYDENGTIGFILEVRPLHDNSASVVSFGEKREMRHWSQQIYVPYILLQPSAQAYTSIRIMLPDSMENAWGIKMLSNPIDSLQLLYANLLILLDNERKIPFPKVDDDFLIRTSDGQIIDAFQSSSMMKNVAVQHVQDNGGKSTYRSLRDVMLTNKEFFKIGRMPFDEYLMMTPYSTPKKKMRRIFAQHNASYAKNMARAKTKLQKEYRDKKLLKAETFITDYDSQLDTVLKNYQDFRRENRPVLTLKSQNRKETKSVEAKSELVDKYSLLINNENLLHTPDSEIIRYNHGDRRMKSFLIEYFDLEPSDHKKSSVRDIILPLKDRILVGTKTLSDRLDEIDCNLSHNDKMQLIFEIHNRFLGVT